MNDPLQAKAEKIIAFAGLTATGSHQLIEERFGVAYDWQKWHFYVTIAAVKAGLLYLAKSCTRDRFLLLLPTILKALTEWDPEGEKFLNDTTAFLDRTRDQGVLRTYREKSQHFALGDTLAVWVLWNILDHSPQDNEWPQVRALGLMLTHPFHDWWALE